MRERRDLRAVPATVTAADTGPNASARPISRIIEDILRHVGEIIRSEMRLAQTEIRQDLRDVKHAGTFLVAAGVAGMFALGFLLLAAVYGLSTIMPPWLAAITVGGVLGIVGFVLLQKGLHLLKATNMTPERTIQSLEDNLKWFKKRVE
jgi:ABC-type protease/lipase transport system fused ATPase/permease subunit